MTSFEEMNERLRSATELVDGAGIRVAASFEHGDELHEYAFTLSGDGEADTRRFAMMRDAVRLAYLNANNHPLVSKGRTNG